MPTPRMGDVLGVLLLLIGIWVLASFSLFGTYAAIVLVRNRPQSAAARPAVATRRPATRAPAARRPHLVRARRGAFGHGRQADLTR